MKSFIISMAIIILGTSAMVFRDDLTRYTILEENIQALTEECALFAAWGLNDPDDDTEVQIDPVLATSNANSVLNYAKSFSNVFAGKDIEITSIATDGTRITVTLVYHSDKYFFRLPFIPKIKDITWISAYEWK